MRTTHEGYGRNRTQIDDKFIDYPSLKEGVRRGVERLHHKFNAFSVPVSQFASNLRDNGYFTYNPYAYQKTLDGIVNGKLLSQIQENLPLPRKIETKSYQFDYNSIPHWEPPYHYPIKVPYKQQGGKINWYVKRGNSSL